MTRHYELLNYSEHGTTVDNVLYSCDFSDKPAASSAGSASGAFQAVMQRSWGVVSIVVNF